MASVQDGLNSQVRNIEARYGKSMDEWVALIAASGKTKHPDVIAMLKTEHGMSHGDANRVSLVSRDRSAAAGQGSAELSDTQWTDELYSGQKAVMRPVHEGVLRAVDALGQDVERSRKKGYLSQRRKKQFGMIQPGSTWVEVGLILKDAPASGRLEPAARSDAMFGHRVRIATEAEIDPEFIAWLTMAYTQAG
jgi:uncharacterized protein DUF5655/uncharacterized protein DUF4287